MKLKKTEKFELMKSTENLKDAIISIVAMLNKSKKGSLCFGVTNTGKIVGQKITKKTINSISRAINKGIKPKVIPHIRETYFGKKSCIQLEFSGEEAPYRAFGRTYIRVNHENLKTSPANIRSIHEQQDKEECVCKEED